MQTTTVATTTTTMVTTTTSINYNIPSPEAALGQMSTVPLSTTACLALCPSAYRDNCNGLPRMICPSSVAAGATVTTIGTQCSETFTCPTGTDPYWFPFPSGPPQLITALPPTMGRCYNTPYNSWFLLSGVKISAFTCMSPT
ncbi:hypothetical protein Aduo_019494 [Ancylostoma duodenale]